jgi:hypothetical protein
MWNESLFREQSNGKESEAGRLSKYFKDSAASFEKLRSQFGGKN